MERRKYVIWKHKPGSGFSTPNVLNRKGNLTFENPDTSTDDIPLLLNEEKVRKKHKGRNDRFKKAAAMIRKHIQRKNMKQKFRSLPSSPYLTRRISIDSVAGLIPKTKQVKFKMTQIKVNISLII